MTAVFTISDLVVPGSAVSASSCSLTFGSKYRQCRILSIFIAAASERRKDVVVEVAVAVVHGTRAGETVADFVMLDVGRLRRVIFSALKRRFGKYDSQHIIGDFGRALLLQPTFIDGLRERIAAFVVEQASVKTARLPAPVIGSRRRAVLIESVGEYRCGQYARGEVAIGVITQFLGANRR